MGKEEKKAPNVLSCDYVDKDSNVIEELFTTKLFLKDVTKNSIGQTIYIDLSDGEYDFIYKREHAFQMIF